MATGKALDGKPYAGNPHVRFDEGEVAPAETPRRVSLLYNQSNITLLALALASTHLAADPVCPVDPTMPFVPELSDEFEGSRLDDTKWADWSPSFRGRTSLGARVVAPGNGYLYCRDNVSTRDGLLRLVARPMRENEKTPENLAQGFDAWALAIVKSRGKGCYGYYEIRAKTMTACLCNGYWLYDPHSDDPDRKFTYGDISEEVDVFEVGGHKGRNIPTRYNPGILCGTIHAYTTPYLEGIVNRTNRNPKDAGKVRVKLPFWMCDGFHTYGLLWTPTNLVWYVDGRRQDDRHNDYIHRPLHITFDCEMMRVRGIPDPKDLPDEFQIDYVRVWRLDPGDPALVARPRIEATAYDWYARHDRICREAREVKCDVVFVGDDATHDWNDSPDRTSFGGFATGRRWLDAWGRYGAINLGFAEDRTGNVLWRLKYGELAGLAPRAFVVNVGGNNFVKTPYYPGDTVAATEAGVWRIVDTLHRQFPSAHVILTGAIPFGSGPSDGHRPQITQLNAALSRSAALHPYVTFVDLSDRLLDTTGACRPEFFESGCSRLSSAGYRVWQSALEPTLAKVAAPR